MTDLEWLKLRYSGPMVRKHVRTVIDFRKIWNYDMELRLEHLHADFIYGRFWCRGNVDANCKQCLLYIWTWICL